MNSGKYNNIINIHCTIYTVWYCSLIILKLSSHVQSTLYCVLHTLGTTSTHLPGWWYRHNKYTLAWLVMLTQQVHTCLVGDTDTTSTHLPGWWYWHKQATNQTCRNMTQRKALYMNRKISLYFQTSYRWMLTQTFHSMYSICISLVINQSCFSQGSTYKKKSIWELQNCNSIVHMRCIRCKNILCTTTRTWVRGIKKNNMLTTI